VNNSGYRRGAQPIPASALIAQGVAESRLRVVDEGDMQTMSSIANEPRLIGLCASFSH
jgi:hypothetical protein